MAVISSGFEAWRKIKGDLEKMGRAPLILITLPIVLATGIAWDIWLVKFCVGDQHKYVKKLMCCTISYGWLVLSVRKYKVLGLFYILYHKYATKLDALRAVWHFKTM